MKLHSILLIVGMIMGSAAIASSMRPADGKPCYSTEKTYFDTDGVTPFACKPAGGPAYSFKVYAGSNLLWSGDLPADQPEVYFDLQAKKEEDKKVTPRLVIKRDLESDPNGYVIFFGESRLAGFKTVTAPGTSISLPQMLEIGWRLLVRPDSGEVDRRFGTVKGGVVDDNDYRLVIRLK